MDWACIRHWFGCDPGKLTMQVFLDLSDRVIYRIERMKSGKQESPAERLAEMEQDAND